MNEEREARVPDAPEAQAAEPGEVVYAAGKRYRKRSDGEVELIGDQEAGDAAEHA